MVFIKSEGTPLLPGSAVAKKRSVKWTAAAVLLCACVIVASVVSFKPAFDAIKGQQQMTELMSASRLAADDAEVDAIADQSSDRSELSGIPFSASTTKLGSLDSGSARNVNINIIRGGGGDDGGDHSAPPPPSPAQIVRDNIQKVNAMQAQVAQQMAHANDELRAQRQRADDLVKAQVPLVLSCFDFVFVSFTIPAGLHQEAACSCRRCFTAAGCGPQRHAGTDFRTLKQ
jgi:hypothetical protein